MIYSKTKWICGTIKKKMYIQPVLNIAKNNLISYIIPITSFENSTTIKFFKFLI